ncbi:MAG: rhodanese-like domain-containing protein [Firmicutes bacterium]|nr:rhodanese-like domain-containing protein [Bacillota bacterium]
MKKYLMILFSCFLMTFLVVGCNKGSAVKTGNYINASVDEVKSTLESGVVVDARSNDAYAGWSTSINKMGGHIEGATDFSANWLTATFDDKENLDAMTRDEHLKKYMDDKKIGNDSSVIVYDENAKDAVAVADYLASQGVKDIKVFDLSLWKDKLVSYANYQLYVPPVVVKDLIEGKEVRELGKVDDLKILEVSWGKEDESGYLTGHVPGAMHVNSDDFDDENNVYMLDKDSVLFDLAKSQGVTVNSTVVVTGNPIFSCRYASILKYLGVENVYVMSGGVTSWTDAGYDLETKSNKGVDVSDFGVTSPKNADLIDTVAEVKAKLNDSDFVLVDNRTIEEYRGETSGYSYYDKAGRVPGAVFGYAGVDNSSSMLYYDNLDTTMRNAYEIEAMWKDADIDTSKHLSFYCGGGYRAAEVLWDALVMGHENTSMFADGWIGWSLAGEKFDTGK